MSREHSHGRARATMPRASRLEPVSGPRAAPERDAHGRVATPEAARELAQGRGWKSQIGKMAGRELQGEARDLGRAAWRLYRALLRDLPSDGPQVRVHVASQARSAVFAARYAERAAELGFDTDDGRKALELSAKLDQRAERAGVVALDIAVAMAKAERTRRLRAIDVHAEAAKAFGDPGATP